MKKTNLIIGAIIILIIAGGIYFYYFSKPEPAPNPEPVDLIENQLKEVCNFDEPAYSCNGEYSCEGKKIDIWGYTLDADNDYAMNYREGPGRAWLEIVNYGDIKPKNYSDYNDMEQNGKYRHQVKVIEDGKGAELKQKIKNIEEDNFTPVKIIVKNVIIVGEDMPTMDRCIRGLYFEAKAEDISFEKVE